MMPYQCILSGLNLAPDYPMTSRKEARIRLRLKISPNKSYLGNQTK
jgi:hypothetical protein